MTIAMRLEDQSQTAEARRNARKLASVAGFDEESAEKVSIVVSEAGTNMLKHAGGGQVLLCTLSSGEIEVLALDNGPGMGDVAACLRDGYSTSGTSGNGLGAISRLSSYCDVYSAPSKGTALLARVSGLSNGIRGRQAPGEPGHIGAVQVPKPGEEVCGDQWRMERWGEQKTLLVADGLGHGPDAAKAAKSATDVLERHPDLAPGELIDAVHHALRPTRGAAVAAARLDRERGVIVFAGLGNISAKISTPGESERHMVSTNGTAGAEARNIREFSYPLPQGALVIMHSDGIATHWGLEKYPRLASRDPGLIAGVIYRDYSRRNDDATIVVLK